MRAEAVGRDRVFDRRHQNPQLQRQTQRHNRMRQAQHVGRTAHVLFHQAHRRSRLQVQTAGVKANAFAHQRQLGTLIAPPHIDQTRGRGTGPTHGVDHRKVVLQQVFTDRDLDLRTMFNGQIAGCLFKFSRPHVFGRRVDQITRPRLCCGKHLDPAGIHSFGRDQFANLWRLVGVSGKTVSGQKPAQRLIFRVLSGKARRNAPRSATQANSRGGQHISRASARFGRAVASQGQLGPPVSIRNHQCRAQRAVKSLRCHPVPDTLGLTL